MNNTYLKSGIFVAALSVALASGCKKNEELQNAGMPVKTGQTKDGITPYTFNWETVDFMPTPAGQSQIPPPWIGQGSIASIYDTDVLNDHRAADGWQLVYNTFNPNASGPLTNPYFMLYNRYRGLLRIYMYTTTSFVANSDYLTDGINVVSNSSSSMLNFNGTDIVDMSTNKKSYIQVEPAPSDGSKPLASNKWYMMQYEFAYDPQIAGLNYSDMRLSWFTNYNSITNISLGGTQTGTLNGTIGSDGSSSSGLSGALASGGKVLGTAALSAIGSNFLNKQSTTGTSNNKLGLPNGIFTSIKDGVSGALKAASGNIPGAVVGILSGLFGGSGGSTQQTVSLNLNSTITLGGPATSSGSFPSSPTAVWLPGTQITSAAQNYIPLYNNTLGVFNLKGVPTIKCNTTNYQSSVNVNGIPYNRYTNEYTVDNTVFNNLFITNPAVINSNPDGATIKNLRTEVVLLNPQTGDPNLYGFYGTTETIGNYSALTGQVVTTQYTVEHSSQPLNNLAAVRVIFDVVPNNGTTPQTLVVKSFFANIATTTTIVPPTGGGSGGH